VTQSPPPPFSLRIALLRLLACEHKMLHLPMLSVLLPLPSSHTELLLPLAVSCTAPSLLLVPTPSKVLITKKVIQ